MERTGTTSRISKTQRESHSEIERKRRERMKRDTEFLHKQIANPHCKDKLSIFQAGAERLIQYTDKLGKRDYIINDEEYSRIIMSTFDGFSIHIRCTDGEVLEVHENVKNILDFTVDEIVGRTIQDLAEPSASTKQIITDAFHGSDFQWNIFKGLIARNFILALHCGPNVPAHHCIQGSDGKMYRFIEFCGDLSHQSTDDPSVERASVVTFHGLCRPLDPACSTIETRDLDTRDPQCTTRTNRKHFTLRLSANHFRIIEAVGEFDSILGCSGDQLLRKKLHDLVIPAERQTVEQMLLEVQTRSPIIGRLHLPHAETNRLLPLDVRLSGIRLGAYFHCIVCRLTALESNLGSGTKLSSEVTAVAHFPTDFCGASSNAMMSATPAAVGAANVAAPYHTQIFKQSKMEDIGYEDNLQMSNRISYEQHPFSVHVVANPQHQSMQSACPDPKDEWFKSIDTSSFQSLLNEDSVPSSDCF